MDKDWELIIAYTIAGAIIGALTFTVIDFILWYYDLLWYSFIPIR